MKAIVIIAAGMAISAAAPALADTNLPSDVKIFLDRVERCQRAARLESYESERRDQIHQTYENLGCRNLVHDENELRAEYADDETAIGALDSAKHAR